MTETVDVLILGGGIGGLAAAHDLRKRGFTGSVRIVERNNTIGGQARSDYIPGTHLPTEYCWRIYGPGYRTLRRIMREIPYGSASVHENLVTIGNVIVPQVRDSYFNMKLNPWSITKTYMREALRGTVTTGHYTLDKLMWAATAGSQRVGQTLGDITWKDYLNGLPPHTQQYLINMIGPILGVDIYKASFSSVFDLARSHAQLDGGVDVMNGPTNERFFSPWEALLRSRNVDIRLNTVVTAVHLDPTNRRNIIAVDVQPIQPLIEHPWTVTPVGSPTRIYATNVVLALPIEIVGPLMQAAYTALKVAIPREIAAWSELATMSKEYMVGMQLYFDRELPYPNRDTTTFYFPESPWQLIITTSGLWRNFDWTTRDPTIRDMWSIGLCDPETVGWVIKKPWTACTREEIDTEVWAQVTRTDGFMKFLPQLAPTAPNPIRPVRSYLWYSYQPFAVSRNGGAETGVQLETYEPKFSPNAGTWNRRPDIYLPDLDNAYMATAYVRGSREMILMDAAAEAGTRVADAVAHKVMGAAAGPPLDLPPGRLVNRPGESILGPIWRLDDARYQQGKPHVADAYFGGSAIIMLIMYLVLILVIVGAAIFVLWKVLQPVAVAPKIDIT